MTCIKTGCHIYITQYGVFARGDAFRVGCTFVFRLQPGDINPLDQVVHFEVKQVGEWFDQRSPNNSTLIAVGEHVIDHGYDGTSLMEFLS